MGEVGMRRKTAAKRLVFIKAAGSLFLNYGFSAVTMESIAAAARGSKVTLYNYFSSKEELFEAWAFEAGEGAFEQLVAAVDENMSPRDVLLRVGIAYLKLITKQEVISINRLIIGEVERFPQLAQRFYAVGPKRTLANLILAVDSLVVRGALVDQDANKMAIHFKALCEGAMFEKLIWGIEPLPSEDRIKELVTDAVDRFILFYARKIPDQNEG
ncbi:TetR/AcrR family transcriptional regulator [Marinomonas rhodophyticola]|uniref:TetR/AcrR family transcriptional regulator n=1 Tax=Marinomonas rhodophyticola TaxID=2992803 RepID=A0ABT3KAY7_9GAMM|nr:TetR/AcrR family transcriptional regulator [Marinomonas sp. KJ51-3]MCW4627695.1 TetR/AcrR family transcriptional regulator [Marinomonas sp. KJ51-3]